MNVQRPAADLPDESEMDRCHIEDAFVVVLNLCKPEHPYYDDPYPVDKDDVFFSYCTRYWAKCGPRRHSNVASYAANKNYVRSCSTEAHLALLTHEVSHITEGRHSSAKSHPKAFWREMAFNAWQLRDNWPLVETSFGPVNEEEYVREVIEDPNSSTVDKRMETVSERRSKQADLLGETYDE
jgi:hypothetical protein